MTTVYSYKAYAVSHCAAPTEAVVKAFGGLAEFYSYFGGGATLGYPPSAPPMVGVWGTRNASRFRRLLREAHGALHVVESEPPFEMSTASRTGPRLSRSARQLAETKNRSGHRDEES